MARLLGGPPTYAETLRRLERVHAALPINRHHYNQLKAFWEKTHPRDDPQSRDGPDPE